MMWKKVEKILKEKGISVYKLSKMTGIPDNTLRNYRSKKSDPSFTNACKIADALDISLDELRDKKVSRSWLALRKEICNYCEDNSENVRWTTLQTKIYDAIRACLDISRLDDMTDGQALRAREIFKFITQERELTQNERISNHA